MAICKTCGASFEGNFCSNCGAKKEETVQAFCTACGAPLVPDAHFCGRCGYEINTAPAESTVSTAPVVPTAASASAAHDAFSDPRKVQFFDEIFGTADGAETSLPVGDVAPKASGGKTSKNPLKTKNEAPKDPPAKKTQTTTKAKKVKKPFKNEERGSNVIRFEDHLRKAIDDEFDALVETVKGLTKEARETAGNNTFVEIIEKFRFIWDEAPTAFLEPLMKFIIFATPLSCRGLNKVSERRKKEVAGYFHQLEAIENFVLQTEKIFNYKEVTDETYTFIMEAYLCASLDPFNPSGREYTNTLFTYMLLVACADGINEEGIKAVRKLREDYLDYAPKRKAGEVEEFKGSFKF